jgi:hypothetical protein
MTPAERIVLDHLDGLDCALNLTALIRRLPELSADDIKEATHSLYDGRRIARVRTMGIDGRTYPLFFSLYIQTTPKFEGDPAPAPAPEPVPAPEPTPGPNDLTIDQANALMERLQQDLAVPEPTVNRRVTDRRQFDVVDVLARWRLPYRLAKVVEVLAGARRSPLTRAEAAAVCRLVRQQVQEE